jgi:hypothetical protein
MRSCGGRLSGCSSGLVMLFCTVDWVWELEAAVCRGTFSFVEGNPTRCCACSQCLCHPFHASCGCLMTLEWEAYPLEFALVCIPQLLLSCFWAYIRR